MTENNKVSRADQLRESFKVHLNGGNKKKILVMMDNVWLVFDMNAIGLSPLPHQVVDFKVFFTSLDTKICTLVGVEVNSIFYVKGLEEQESQGSFCQLLVFFDDGDHNLRLVGEDIERRCCDLLIAIRPIACILKNKSKDAWDEVLSRSKHHEIGEIVHQVFKMSYNLKDDTKSILLLCGLFPEDFNITVEDLVRYA